MSDDKRKQFTEDTGLSPDKRTYGGKRVYKLEIVGVGKYITDDFTTVIIDIYNVGSQDKWVIESYVMDSALFESLPEFQGF